MRDWKKKIWECETVESDPSRSTLHPCLWMPFGCGCGIPTGFDQPNLGALTTAIVKKYILIWYLVLFWFMIYKYSHKVLEHFIII